MYVFCFIVATFFVVLFFRKWRKALGFTFFGTLSFYVIMILWIPYYIVCNSLLNLGWEYPVRPESMFYITAAFCLFCMVSMLLKRILIPNKRILTPAAIQAFSRSANGRFFSFVAFVVSASCLAGLFLMKGVTLDVGNYGTRFESNAGTGLFTILSYSMVTVAVLLLYRKPSLKALFVSIALVLAYGMMLFLTLGGARNYLIAAIIPVLIAGYSLRLISLKVLSLFGLMGVLMITSLALVRYGDSVGVGLFELLALYTRDTVFPVESLTNIIDRSINFAGFDYFFNQFYAIIPRALWPGKPIYLDTIAYFYTEQILGYGKGLIIAPTGIGSLYIMGGWIAIFLGSFLISVFFVVLDYFALRRKVVFYFCAFPSIFFAFFCFRESMELGIYKILLHSMFALGVYSLSTVVYRFLPKKQKPLLMPAVNRHIAKTQHAG
ncbi:WzyE family oligosaccharide polymerase [Pseudomonas fragi]|uniref:WzyE family oligosaccharide polymerase n=1 Tax=Pseudomonas fragi TaxID=296 RepID=A0ABT4WVD0_PSEFR|nr:WzyE family oligosaccharide polymerase [Pseudomonas fragi]MDA7023369.1 WzyE family oligosaccharide polymerase [Pseudomonas fragi]